MNLLVIKIQINCVYASTWQWLGDLDNYMDNREIFRERELRDHARTNQYYLYAINFYDICKHPLPVDTYYQHNIDFGILN